MPNSPAKNISSLASHTITPTLTMFGRFSVWILVLIAGAPEGLVAVVTDGLWTASHDHAPAGRAPGCRRGTSRGRLQHAQTARPGISDRPRPARSLDLHRIRQRPGRAAATGHY